MGRFATMEELGSFLGQNGGVVSIVMEEVRDAYNAGRLGIHVRKGISDRLRSLGIGHLPHELPDNQHSMVRLYRLGTQIAGLIDAVVHPGEANDAKIRGALAEEDAELVRKIRELIC